MILEFLLVLLGAFVLFYITAWVVGLSFLIVGSNFREMVVSAFNSPEIRRLPLFSLVAIPFIIGVAVLIPVIQPKIEPVNDSG